MIVSDRTGSFKAYDARTGADLWTARVTRGDPVAAGDLVLVQGGSADRTLYAIETSTGSVRWQIPVEGSPLSPPTRALDTVVVPSRSEVIGVNGTDGSTRWTAPGVLPNSAVATDASSIYTTSFKLSVLDGRTGEVRAEGRLSDVSIFPAVPAGDTTVVIMSDSVGGYR